MMLMDVILLKIILIQIFRENKMDFSIFNEL